MAASVTPQTPPNTITFTPGGTVVINGSAICGNNALSIQIQNKEICYIDSSGNLSTAGGGGGITQLTGDVTAGPGSGSQGTTITNAVKSVGSFGSSPAAGGASIATTILTLQPADATHPGSIVASGAQTLGATLTLPNTLTIGGTATIPTLTLSPTAYFGGPKISLGADFIIGSSDGSGARVVTSDVILDLGAAGAWIRLGGGVADFTIGGTIKAIFGYTDLSGTPGAGTANTPSGSGALVATSGASFMVTNSFVGPDSVIIISYAGAPDSTAGALGASYISGGFTVYSAGVAAGNTKFNWFVIN